MNNNLMQKLKSCLRALNTEKLEKFFFALFLLSIPIQTRLTFVTPQTYLNGNFNEYVTFFLYLSDLLLITTLLIYFVNLIKKRLYLTKTNNFSIKAYIFRLFHTYPRLIPIFTLFITLITWSFITIFWSEYQNIALYQTLKLLEFGLLFMYTGHRLKWFGINKFMWIIFISGFIESIIGIAQYYLQKSLGLKILMESVLSPEIPNVAKIVVDGERIIRAYGTFPHPNVFSGFLILSIFCGIWLLFSNQTLKPALFNSYINAFIIKLFHVKQFIYLIINTQKSTINITSVKTSESYGTTTDKINIVHNHNINNNQIVSRETIWFNLVMLGIIIQLSAFIFTFSRIAWFAFILIFIIFIILIIKSKLFHVKQFENIHRRLGQFIQIVSRETICMVVLIVLLLLLIIGINWRQITNRTSVLQNTYQQSTDMRIIYNNIATNIIKDNPIFGIGSKNFTIRMQSFYDKPLKSWQFQPTHNIYLLIASELGIIGLILFLLLLYFFIKTSYCNNKTKIVSRETILTKTKQNGTILLQVGLISIFSGFLIIGLFDHYFWTLQQGQLTFWIVLGTISCFGSKK